MSPKPFLQTGSQTAGPFLHIGLGPNHAGIPAYGGEDLGARLFPESQPGKEIELQLGVQDGNGDSVTDGVVEVWQADPEGRYRGNCGFGRFFLDSGAGTCRMRTLLPGCVTALGGAREAPHLTLWVAARGINVGLRTRMYFPDRAEENSKDPILLAVPAARRSTLVAKAAGEHRYRFDIVLQGPSETVFFEIGSRANV